MMKYEMNDKIAFVTGAGSGMGLAAAQAFAKAGATVIMADINVPINQSAQIIAEGQKAVAIHCDVTDEKEVEAVIQEAVAKFGQLDYAFNNAGIQSVATELADVSNKEYNRIIDVNLNGVWNCMKYELQQMRKQGSGVIVNNSSLGGLGVLLTMLQSMAYLD